MMKKITNFKEMMEAFRHIFRDTEDRQDLVQVLRVLNDYFTLLEEVQKLPLRLRQKYWACTSTVFFYLQVHKQLGRNEGPFCRSAKKNIYKAFSIMMKKYDEP